MNKKYKENLIYIPTDLVGNNIVDSIRKEFELGTKINPARREQIISDERSEVKFKKLSSDEKTKLYEFRVENFAGDKAVKEYVDGLLAKGFTEPVVAILATLKILGTAVRKAATPIFNRDLFFDVSFPAGRIVDESFFLPADATEEEIAESKQAENL